MKLLFTRFPYASAHGGAEVQTISLMKELKRRGNQVAFMGSCPTLLVLCRQADIPTAELDIGKPPVSKWTALGFVWRRWKMKKQLESALQEYVDHGLDTVCMLSVSEKLLLTPLAVRKGLKVIWIEHDSLGRWLRWNPWLPQLRQLSRQVTTVGVSELSRQAYVDLGWQPETVVTIANGINAERFAGLKPTEAKDGVIRIGAVARLAHEKGLDVLIESMADLTWAELTIVGVGDQAEALQQRIHTQHLEDRVTIENRIGEVRDLYRDVDIFVLPSRSHDPFGLVAAEAMAAGVATVVTDACGIAAELQHGSNALVVPAGDVKALAGALQNLAEDPVKRKNIAESGQQKALTDFTVEKMVDRYENILKT